MQRVKRPILLTGLIISVISFSIIFLTTLKGIFIVGEFELYLLLAILCILMILSIIGIVFSSVGLASCGKPYEVYKNKSSFILTVFIIQCIMISLLIVGIISGEIMFNGFMFLEFILMVIGAVFTIIGYVKAKQNTVYEFTRNQSTFEDAYNKIEKLQKLRELNIISEEEFESLKRKQIEQLSK